MLRFISTIVLCLAVPFFAAAQIASLRLTVVAPRGTDTTKDVFLAGNFNHWQAGDSFYRMKKISATTYALDLPAFRGRTYEYKYNRGRWSEVEVASSGADVPNRSVVAARKTVRLLDTVSQWKHPAPARKKPSLPPAVVAKKDSLMATLQPKLEGLLGLLKAYVNNLLQPQPSDEKQRQIRDSLRHFAAEASAKIHGLCAGVAAALTPQQKQRILASLASPNQQGDFINTLLAALSEALQEPEPGAVRGSH